MNNILTQKLFPLLEDGLHKVTIKEYKNAVITNKKEPEKTETYYIPVLLELETGRVITYNVFEDNFLGRFIAPIQAQVDPSNTKIWETVGDFLDEVITNKTVLDCWSEKVSYLSATGMKTTWNYNFSEPQANEPTTDAPKEAADIPFN